MHYHFYHEVLQNGLDQEASRNGACPHSPTPYADMMAYFNDQLFKTSGDLGQAGVAEDSNEEDPNAAFRRQVEQSLHLGLVEHWSEQAVSISWNCEKYTNTWIWLSSLLRSIPWHHLLFPPMRPTLPTHHQLWRRMPQMIQVSTLTLPNLSPVIMTLLRGTTNWVVPWLEQLEGIWEAKAWPEAQVEVKVKAEAEAEAEAKAQTAGHHRDTVPCRNSPSLMCVGLVWVCPNVYIVVLIYVQHNTLTLHALVMYARALMLLLYR